MNQPEQDDAVWKLLDHASKVDASPFFAKNVVREVRLDSARESGLFAAVKSLFTPRAAGFGSVAAIVVAVALVVLVVPQENVDSEIASKEASEFDPASEYEEVEYRGQLMAVVDPGQLSDEALVDLFF